MRSVIRCDGFLRARGVLHALAALAATLIAAPGAFAQDRFIEDVRVSRVAQEVTIEIQLACPMRFQADFPTQAGSVIEVRVAPFDACRALGSRGEIRRPLNGRLAGLEEIEYEPLGPGSSLVMLRFTRGVGYRISQGRDLRTLIVTVDMNAEPPADAVPQPPVLTTLPPEPEAAAPGARRPMVPRVVTPATTADYMINLQSTREPVDPRIAAQLTLPAGTQLYVSRTQVDGQTWYRLRVGFFESEPAARVVLEPLYANYPRAWIGRAETQEIETAQSFALQNTNADLALVSAETFEGRSEAELAQLPSEEVAARMRNARETMLDGDNETAIATYVELIQTAGEHRAEAAEYLGLAYERAGLPNQARAQYEWYLREFSNNAGTARVRQRLNGIVLAAAPPQRQLRDASLDSRWETAYGVSQYYRRDENQFDEDQDSITTLSALISDFDLSIQRRGDSFDMTGRMSVSHFHDLLDDSGPGDQERIAYAYFDLESNLREWWLRVGRQTLNSFGVLGRFDGARLDYTWADQRVVHVMMGYPVESTRDSLLEKDRDFYGAAVEFQDLIGNWDLSVFVNHQSIEGIDARQALGTEVRYSDEKRTLTGILDFDADYSELNTMLLFGTWRVKNRFTLSALVDERKSPILTTRNALIGQPVGTIEELLLVWTEEEIRQLAVDRTAESSTITLGLAAPLGQRFQINFDYTSTEVSGTLASGGVAAVESTGTQSFYSTSIVGSGLIKSGDVSILNLRYGSSDQFESTTLTWDIRIPVGRRIRLNPRLRLNSWKGLLNGRERDSISPTLRLLFNTRQHYRVELEVGADRQTRIDGMNEREAKGSFINLGYRANF